jgi:hypothetical protein
MVKISQQFTGERGPFSKMDRVFLHSSSVVAYQQRKGHQTVSVARAAVSDE